MKKIRRAILSVAIWLSVLPASLLAKSGQSSTAQALQYFQEADAVCRADNGRLWGVPLGGGLLLVDPETRIAYANQPDPEARLARVDRVDDSKMDWRAGLRPTTDLAALLLKSRGLTLPANSSVAANVRAKKYDAASLAIEEDAREHARQKVLQDYRARLVDGPILQLPLRNMRMEFDPGSLVPLDTLGTVYPHIRIVDDWGVLEVKSHGALLGTDFTRAAVPQPERVSAGSLAGDDWTLVLTPGWSVAPGARKGDSQLQLTSTP